MKKGLCKNGHILNEENSYFRKDGTKTCKICAIERMKRYYENPEKRNQILIAQKKSYHKNLEERRLRNRTNWQKNKDKYNTQKRGTFPEKLKQIKTEVLTYYGNGKLACVCCEISEIAFLTLDHSNGRKEHERGTHEKRAKYSGRSLWAYLKRNNFPKGYETLCWNCNSGKQINKGICPHKLQ